MFTSFSTALSALGAHTTAVDVVGNNLANLNTPGYKSSVVVFSDLVTQSLGAGWVRIISRLILPNVLGAVMSGAFLSFAIVIGEFTMAALLNRPAFGPYMQLLGANRAYEPAALAVIAFAATWGCMGLMQLISRLLGVRKTAK